jgi:hypothetical protein
LRACCRGRCCLRGGAADGGAPSSHPRPPLKE